MDHDQSTMRSSLAISSLHRVVHVLSIVTSACLLLLVPVRAFAQAQGSAAATPRNPRLVFDRNSSSYGGVLPFDQDFFLVNSAPVSLLRVTAWYLEAQGLPRSACADLSGRALIRRSLRTVVNAELSALTSQQRDEVDSALATKMYRRPWELFDEGVRDSLKGSFQDTLSKLKTAGLDTTNRKAVQAALVRDLDKVPIYRVEQLWWRRRPLMVRRAEWIRETKATPSDTFALGIGPLSANRDYTFCVESVEALTVADSTALISQISGEVRKTLLDKLGETLANVEIDTTTLRTLQVSLRRASLPAVDSLVAPQTSMLAAAPEIGAVRKTFVGIANLYQARCTFASLVNTLARTEQSPIPADAPVRCGSAQAVGPTEMTLGWSLRLLASDPGLVKLAGVARTVSKLPKPEAERLAALSVVVRAVASLTCPAPGSQRCSEAETMARGQTPITNPRLPVEGNANVAKRTSAAEVKPFADNLDSTLARLRELRDVVGHVEGDPDAQKELGIKTTELGNTRLAIEQARSAAEAQRIQLRLLMDALTAMEVAVRGMAAGVVGRDLVNVGIASTSSASYETRARWHVGQDLGVIYAWRGKNIHETAPYLGVAIYVRPVNKRGNLPVFCPWDLRCTAFTLGVATSKFEEKDKYTGVLNGIPLVLGVGTRIGSYLRLSYNQPLVYTYRYDSDGTSHRRVDRLNSVTLSLDADIRDILGALATSLFGK